MSIGLANTLRAARNARGWTQAELATAIGVSRKTINTVENGVFVPSTILALRLARALDTNVEALFCLADQPSPIGEVRDISLASAAPSTFDP